MNIEKDIEEIAQRAEENARKIDRNAELIQQNTGALSILRGFKAASNRFFVMWLITFIAFLISIGYIVYLLG